MSVALQDSLISLFMHALRNVTCKDMCLVVDEQHLDIYMSVCRYQLKHKIIAGFTDLFSDKCYYYLQVHE